MKRLSFALVAAVVLFASTSYAPPAYATREFEEYRDYYDSNLNRVGSMYWGCSGIQHPTGTQAGEWKYEEFRDCHTDEITTEVDHYCSGSWVVVGYLGDTSC